MSNVMFLTGSSYAKKRKRVKGANHVQKAEVKKINLVDGSSLSSHIYLNIYNIYLSSSSGTTGIGSWFPFKLVWPSAGTGDYQRIGNQFKLKYIRCKGSIGVQNRALIGCRWRLKLIRSDSSSFPVASGVQTAINAYLGIYQNSTPVDLTGSFLPQAQIAKHNFYGIYKNVEKRNNYSVKVIASGYFPPSQEVYEGVDVQVGSQESVTKTLKIHPIMNQSLYSVPVDVKITCNDWIDVDDISYYLVMETDMPWGFVFDNNSEHGWAYSGLTENHLFKANFFVEGFFIDP